MEMTKFILLFVSVILFSSTEAFENCLKDTPIQVSINLPRVLRQRVDKPFPLKIKGRISEELQGPLKIVLVVQKEWFAGFWSVVPCVSFGFKNCEYTFTDERMKEMSAHYPLEKQQFHHEYSLDLNSVPKDFLQGNYKIRFMIWSYTPRRRLVGCLRGDLKADVTRMVVT